ncbi:MAG: hypothetical protein JWP94_497 [Mucilaginibacter sp.]|nr:hypothetical protein [Mucilaginibacter sp.]
MLHQISWLTYSVSIILLVAFYYLYAGLTFYRFEIQAVIYKLAGKQPATWASGQNDLQFPDHAIMGKAQPDDVEFVSQEELSFGPADHAEGALNESPTIPGTDSRLASDFSDMSSEVKTLIRVINESGESKENFDMLFRLIVQKYAELAGTAYEQQINDFLIAEGSPQFPFTLTIDDLQNYWLNEN